MLKIAEFHHLVDCCREAVGILSSGLSVVGLSTEKALNELGSLAYNLAGIEGMALNHIVGEHHAQHGFIPVH